MGYQYTTNLFSVLCPPLNPFVVTPSATLPPMSFTPPSIKVHPYHLSLTWPGREPGWNNGPLAYPP